MKKLIFNIFTLIVTTTLLIVVCLAWYTSNKNVSANGIIASTLGDEYSLKLERRINSDGELIWKDTKNLSFTNLNPGNKFYFRIVIDSPKDSSFQATISFDNVESELQPNKLVVENGSICKYVPNQSSSTNSSTINKNVPLYKIENNKVTVKVNDIDKTLYSIDNNNISLADLKIQDVFKFYKIDENSIDADLSNKTSISLKNVNELYDLTSDSNGKAYLYFVLEFNENASLALIDGKQSSNAYLYQKLIIGSISIQTNKNNTNN